MLSVIPISVSWITGFFSMIGFTLERTKALTSSSVGQGMNAVVTPFGCHVKLFQDGRCRKSPPGYSSSHTNFGDSSRYISSRNRWWLNSMSSFFSFRMPWPVIQAMMSLSWASSSRSKEQLFFFCSSQGHNLSLPLLYQVLYALLPLLPGVSSLTSAWMGDPSFPVCSCRSTHMARCFPINSNALILSISFNFTFLIALASIPAALNILINCDFLDCGSLLSG